MEHQKPKKVLLNQLATVAKAMAHPNRLELLDQAAQGEQSVETLAEATGLSVGNSSQHLQRLRRAGLLRARREGTRVLYSLADESVLALVGALREVAKRNVAEVQQLLSGYFYDRDSLEPVSRQELLGRLRDGLVTLIDVRPEREFRLGHIPGALNIPLAELEHRLETLSADHEVVAYCRGPYCVFSYEAVARLRERGFQARRLEDGFPEWRAAALPVEAPGHA